MSRGEFPTTHHADARVLLQVILDNVFVRLISEEVVGSRRVMACVCLVCENETYNGAQSFSNLVPHLFDGNNRYQITFRLMKFLLLVITDILTVALMSYCSQPPFLECDC